MIFRIPTSRTSGTITGAKDIGTNDKIFIRIKDFTLTEEITPPFPNIGTGSKGMTNPNNIVS